MRRGRDDVEGLTGERDELEMEVGDADAQPRPTSAMPEGETGDMLRVACGDEQALFATPQLQQVWALIMEQRAGQGCVVDAVAVT